MKYKIITPNINLQAKNPKLAYIARGAVLIGTLLLFILQLLAILDGGIDLIVLLLGFIPILVEFDYVTLFVKEPHYRGILYVILGVILYSQTPIYIAGTITLGGILFVIYHFQ